MHAVLHHLTKKEATNRPHWNKTQIISVLSFSCVKFKIILNIKMLNSWKMIPTQKETPVFQRIQSGKWFVCLLWGGAASVAGRSYICQCHAKGPAVGKPVATWTPYRCLVRKTKRGSVSLCLGYSGTAWTISTRGIFQWVILLPLPACIAAIVCICVCERERGEGAWMDIHACVGNKEVVEHELHQHGP